MVGGHDKECLGSVTFQIQHRILQSILALQTNTHTVQTHEHHTDRQRENNGPRPHKSHTPVQKQ